jgi:hypothetical protein
MPQYKAELARAYNSLAAVAFDAGHPTEGIAMFGKAAEVWAALAAKYDTPEYHGELGISLGNQGRALEKSEPDKARLMLARALIELEIGLKANPKDPTFGDARQRQRLVLAGLLARPAFSQAVGK